jgi:hypothetical protein
MHLFVRLAVITGMLNGCVRCETIEKRKVAPPLARLVSECTSRQHRKPAPECFLILEDLDVPHHAHKRCLQAFTRRLFVAAGNDQQVSQQSVKVSVIKYPVSRLIARGHCAGQFGNIERFAGVFIGSRGMVAR